MAEQARITSIEALERFRSKLILFLSAVRSRLDEAGDEVKRARQWIETDRRLFWEGEIRRRHQKLDLAEQALLAARMSSLKDNLSMEMLAARRARQAVEEAGAKLAKVKMWSRDFESAVAPAVKRMESLRGLLDQEMPKAIEYLRRTREILEDYAGIAPRASRHQSLPEEEPSVEENPSPTKE